MESLKTAISEFYPYAKKSLGFDKPARIFLRVDNANAQSILGKTAQYEPNSMKVTVFVSNRHPKDILRSISHELVHHAQNCRGDLNTAQAGESGYTQADSHMREMEREAYECGNLIFRDWEDGIKYHNQESNIMEHWKKRKQEFGQHLMEKWGYKKKKTDEVRIVDPELDIDHVVDEAGMSDEDIMDYEKEDPPEWREADQIVDSITSEIDSELKYELGKAGMSEDEIYRITEAVKVQIEEKLLDMALELVKKGGQANA